MGQLFRLLIQALLVGLLIVGFSNPVSGDVQAPSSKISIEKVPRVVTSCSTFEVEFWIREIPNGFSMTEWTLVVFWDPTLMELNESLVDISDRELARWFDRGWDLLAISNGENWIGFIVEVKSGDPWTEDAVWFTLTFHCLGDGRSSIKFGGSEETELAMIEYDRQFETFPEDFFVIVSQVKPAPVGGVSTSINKFEILIPYITLAGLIAAVSTVYVIKKRKA